MTVDEEKWVSWIGEVAREVTESQGSGVGVEKKDTIQKAELDWAEAPEKPKMIRGRAQTSVAAVMSMTNK